MKKTAVIVVVLLMAVLLFTCHGDDKPLDKQGMRFVYQQAETIVKDEFADSPDSEFTLNNALGCYQNQEKILSISRKILLFPLYRDQQFCGFIRGQMMAEPQGPGRFLRYDDMYLKMDFLNAEHPISRFFAKNGNMIVILADDKICLVSEAEQTVYEGEGDVRALLDKNFDSAMHLVSRQKNKLIYKLEIK